MGTGSFSQRKGDRFVPARNGQGVRVAGGEPW